MAPIALVAKLDETNLQSRPPWSPPSPPSPPSRPSWPPWSSSSPSTPLSPCPPASAFVVLQRPPPAAPRYNVQFDRLHAGLTASAVMRPDATYELWSPRTLSTLG